MEMLTCDISSSKLSSFAICCSSCGSPAGQIFPTRSITEASLSMFEDWLSNNWPSEGEIQLHNLHVNTIIYFPSRPLLLRIYIFVGREWRELVCGPVSARLSQLGDSETDQDTGSATVSVDLQLATDNLIPDTPQQHYSGVIGMTIVHRITLVLQSEIL
ncbi:hypothetical protein VPH35_089432 [Triticum aestivum]